MSTFYLFDRYKLEDYVKHVDQCLQKTDEIWCGDTLSYLSGKAAVIECIRRPMTREEETKLPYSDNLLTKLTECHVQVGKCSSGPDFENCWRFEDSGTCITEISNQAIICLGDNDEACYLNVK